MLLQCLPARCIQEKSAVTLLFVPPYITCLFPRALRALSLDWFWPTCLLCALIFRYISCLCFSELLEFVGDRFHRNWKTGGHYFSKWLSCFHLSLHFHGFQLRVLTLGFFSLTDTDALGFPSILYALFRRDSVGTPLSSLLLSSVMPGLLQSFGQCNFIFCTVLSISRSLIWLTCVVS